jgi:AcrR family transcriptional regulator
MSAKREQLVETAERLFYREGFHATGVDRVIAEAGVARMTLYKHFSSKDELVIAVLRRRAERYWSGLTTAVETTQARGHCRVLAMLDAHGEWLAHEGAQGCMFMKALGEYAGHGDQVVDVAAENKRRLLAFVRGLLEADGLAMNAGLVEQIAMLVEGATTLVHARLLEPRAAAQQTRHAAEQLIGASGTRQAESS